MAKLGVPADLIIGDGGSTDGSIDLERLSKLPVRSLLVKTGLVSSARNSACCWRIG
jgi:hypothetical protein